MPVYVHGGSSKIFCEVYRRKNTPQHVWQNQKLYIGKIVLFLNISRNLLYKYNWCTTDSYEINNKL